jgi:hypothetical protein
VRGGWLGLSHAWKERRGVMLPGVGHGEWATWGEADRWDRGAGTRERAAWGKRLGPVAGEEGMTGGARARASR